MAGSKKHIVISFDRMPENISAAFNEKYPGGVNDCFDDLVKYEPGINPLTGKPITPFYAVTVETEDTYALVKINVKVDDLEDVERWLDGEEAAENEQVAGSSSEGIEDGDTLPDDNISQYGEGDDDQSEV